MSIQVSEVTTHRSFSPPQAELEPLKPTKISAVAAQKESKSQLNASIVKASMDVAIESKNQPLALLYKSVIESLNEVLKADFGDNAIQNALGQDNTPEGTAGRIVAMSTGFFEAYRLQHPGEDEGALLKHFMEVIQGGFEQGYGEARQILDGLGVLTGDIASNIEKTHELVLQGYADFQAANTAKTEPHD